MTAFESARIPFLLVSALVFCPPLAAQEEEDAGGNESESDVAEAVVEETITVEARYVPEDAITATKIPTLVRLIPASVSSISSTLLAEQNATTLHEAMQNVAGVTTHRDAGAIEMFFLRGFDSVANGLLLTDGAYEPRTGINQTYNVDRFEVVRGPIGFLYGGNALAGAVNLVRKRPLAESFGRFSLLGGSYSTAYGTLDVNRGGGDGRPMFRVNAMWHSTDNYRDDKEGEVWAVNPSITFQAGERTTINVDLEAQRTTGRNDGGIPLVLGAVPDVPRTRSYQSPFDEFEQDTGRVRINVDSEISDRLQIRNKTYYTDQDWTNSGTLLFGTIPLPFGGALVIRSFGILDQQVAVLGNQLDTIHSFTTGSVEHELVAGIEYQDLEVDAFLDFGLLPFIDVFNPIETATQPIVFFPGTSITLDLDTETIAPYVLDTMHFSDRWHLSLGGRIDFLDQSNAAIGISQSDDELSPFVGLLFSPSERLSIYANYGEVFNPVSLAVASGAPEPETGEGAEFGIKSQALSGRLRTSVTVYTLEKKNIPTVDQTGIVAQQGDQETQGLEIEISANPAPGLELLFTYGYTDAELTRFAQQDPFTGLVFDRSGNEPAYVPEHVFNSWVGKRFNSGFAIAGGVRYVSDRFINEANDFKVDSYVTADANLSYERERWKATVHLKNLTDEDYETRVVNQSAILPAPGFNASAGIHLSF